MAETVFTRKPPDKAVEICRRFDAGDDARCLLRDDLTADGYLLLLIDKQLHDDALKLMAHWLPKPEAIWWGCLCVWKTCRPNPSEKDVAALQAAVQWVVDPTEEHRRQAETAGQKAGASTPSGCLALACFWSEGSMAPAGQPEVAPPPYLTGQIVAAALNLAATQAEVDSRTEHQRLFIQLGREVASGKNRWTS
jgi:Family of unknown function (DUF6931)